MISIRRSFIHVSMLTLTFTMIAALGTPARAQEAPAISVGGVHIHGMPDDWTHQRVRFSDPGTEADALAKGTFEQWQKIVNDPRYVMQQLKRFQPAQGPAALDVHTSESAATERLQRSLPKPRGATINKDWSMVLGSGSTTVGTGMYPAKYSFSTTATPECGSDTTPDYVIYNTSALGSSSQASIVAYDNLYSSCSGMVPSVFWAFNTGGTVTTSPSISLDGTQVAFIQTPASGNPQLVVLTPAAQPTGHSLTSGSTPLDVTGGTTTTVTAATTSVTGGTTATVTAATTSVTGGTTATVTAATTSVTGETPTNVTAATTSVTGGTTTTVTAATTSLTGETPTNVTAATTGVTGGTTTTVTAATTSLTGGPTATPTTATATFAVVGSTGFDSDTLTLTTGTFVAGNVGATVSWTGGSTTIKTVNSSTTATLNAYEYLFGATDITITQGTGVGIVNGSTTFFVTSGLAAGMVGEPISGTGIPAGTTIAGYTSATQGTLSQAATSNGTDAETLTIGVPVTSGSTQFCITTAGLTSGMVGAGITGTGIPSGDYIASVAAGGYCGTLHAAATSTNNADALTIYNGVINGSTTLTTTGGLTAAMVGAPITGTGIPAGATLASYTSATSGTLSAAANAVVTTADTLTVDLAVTNASKNFCITTAGLTSGLVGAGITGTGIPSGDYIASVTSSGYCGTLNAAATSTTNADALTIYNGVIDGSTTLTTTGGLTAAMVGEPISGTGIPAGATLAGFTSATQGTLSAAANAVVTAADTLTIGYPVTSGSTNFCITTAGLTSGLVGAGISGTGIPGGDYIASVASSGYCGTLNAAATSTNNADALTIYNGVIDGSTTLTTTGGLTAAMVGAPITGTGIPAGATLASYTSATSGTLSAAANAVVTAADTLTVNLGVTNASTNFCITTPGLTGLAGAGITGTGIPGGDSIATVTSPYCGTLATAASSSHSGDALTIYNGVIDGSTTLTTTGGLTAAMVGEPISGTGIPAGATLASYTSATSGTLSAAANAVVTAADTLTIGYPVTSGSTQFCITTAGLTSGLVGAGITGTGIPSGDYIASVAAGGYCGTLHAAATSTNNADALTIYNGVINGSATLTTTGGLTAAMVGAPITGTGIPAGATLASYTSATSGTLSAAANAVVTAADTLTVDLGVTNASKNFCITAADLTAGMVGAGISGTDIPAGDTIALVTSAYCGTLTTAASASDSADALTIYNGVIDGSTTLTTTGGLTAAMVGAPITGTGIPAGATLASYTSATSGTLSAAANAVVTAADTLTVDLGVTTASTNFCITTAGLTSGMVGAGITGTGIPGSDSIATVTSPYCGTLASAASSSHSGDALTIYNGVINGSTALTTTGGLTPAMVGAPITGTGIQAGTTLASYTSATSGTLSVAANAVVTAADTLTVQLAVTNASTNFCITTAGLSSGLVGAGISGTGIPGGDTIASVASSGYCGTLNAAATSTHNADALTVAVPGVESGSTTFVTTGGLTAMDVGAGISGTGIPAGDTIASVASATSGTLTTAATATATSAESLAITADAGAPDTLTALSPASYAAGCTAPCMTTVTFSGSSRTDAISSPFYDYSSDTIWVGDGQGGLHKFHPVFGGAPAEVGSPWASPSTTKLASPVYDGTNVYVGDAGGYVYSVTSSGTVTKSVQVATGPGIVDAPLLDGTNGKLWVVVASDMSATSSGGSRSACSSSASYVACDGVIELPVSFTSSTEYTESVIGTASTAPLYDGDFDNLYWTADSGNGTGNMYVNGVVGGTSEPKLMRIPMSAAAFGTNACQGGTGTPAGASGAPECAINIDNPLTSAAAAPGPVTEIYNSSSGTDYDWIFTSVTANGNQAITSGGTACTGACIYSWNVNTALAADATAANGMAATGGTSGVIVDNTSVVVGASQVYFSTLGSVSGGCNTSGAVTEGGCAIQASQSSLN